jgi:hypothetical protein
VVAAEAAAGLGLLILRPAFPGSGTRLTRDIPGAVAADQTVVYSKRTRAIRNILVGGVMGGSVALGLLPDSPISVSDHTESGAGGNKIPAAIQAQDPATERKPKGEQRPPDSEDKHD